MAIGLFSLPNEILLHILNPIPTHELLQLTPTSHRLYAIIIRILHQRLLLAAELPERTLLLECYHPSVRLTEPPLYCTYLGTEGLDRGIIISEQGIPGHDVPIGRLGDYNRLYSTFKPLRRAPDPAARRMRHPAGDIPGSRTYPSSSSWMEKATSSGEVVKQTLSLDCHELFTQLIASVNLVRSGPRRGLFFNFTEIVDKGVVRVWREWLKRRADGTTDSSAKDGGRSVAIGTEGMPLVATAEDEKILWTDSLKRVGLKFNVRERRWRRDGPVLMVAEEEVPVSYDVEFEELLIRTSHLAFKVEESLIEQSSPSGKAVVFGSFARESAS
ncbi:hypothetical protein NA57DRAFT_75704 [Rhizodiscina lignyota]|uniref:F-box domain-containing protein n=1 Tax=Rhizodiscina lignyota TaxID=1504668 RepID=A0A9P4IFQ5_9PEZI|nr:hypothetical protein NA57DRAFT_75704 [Rhizodiscina lignyota]